MLTLVVAVGCAGERAGERHTFPNLIVIMFDDVGYNDLGCYYVQTAAAERIDTPNIDQLAREGLRFTQFYAAAAVCTASRAAFLTGAYPPRVGLSKADSENGRVLDMQSRVYLNPQYVTIAEVLKTKGYATGCIGKWHLGHEGDGLPTRHGFDYYYGAIFRDQLNGNVMLENEKRVATVSDEELTRRFTQEAVSFIKEKRREAFFLYLAHWMPHVPLAVSKEWRGKAKRGIYGDVIAELDWSVGEITAALEELGLRDNTIVVVTSDNGPATAVGPDGGNSYPLRGGKASPYEGGYRVPFIISWPGTVPPNETCGEVATLMDLMPTMVAITGAEGPQDGEVDGHNIRELMQSPRTVGSPYDAFYYYDRNELKAVRWKHWKLIFPRPNFKDRAGSAGLRLYDLSNDPGENYNLVARETRVVARIEALADLMREDLGDDRLDMPGKNRGLPGGVTGDRTQSPSEGR